MSLALTKAKLTDLRSDLKSVEKKPNSSFELCKLLQTAWDDGEFIMPLCLSKLALMQGPRGECSVAVECLPICLAFFHIIRPPEARRRHGDLLDGLH